MSKQNLEINLIPLELLKWSINNNYGKLWSCF